MSYGIFTAMLAMCPGVEWSTADPSVEDYDNILWPANAPYPKPTLDEINEWIRAKTLEEPLRLLRIERNRRLTAVDYVTIRAYSRDQTVPAVWKQYLQQLRDLPQTATPRLNERSELDMDSVAWLMVPK